MVVGFDGSGGKMAGHRRISHAQGVSSICWRKSRSMLLEVTVIGFALVYLFWVID